MGLKAPSIIIFLISIVIAVTVLIVRFFGADVPFLTSDAYQFYGMLFSWVLLVLGNLGRGI